MNNLDKFFNSITVIDTETTNLIAELSEVVEIAAAHRVDSDWVTDSILLGAVKGIPPEASAKNNISNRMIAGLPTFNESIDKIYQLLRWPNSTWYVAHNSKYDQKVLSHSWLNAGLPKNSQLCEDQTRWICTYRLSRHILQHDFVDCEYSLNYLRYKLDLPVPDNIQLHRANDDTYLTVILLEELINRAVKNNLITLDDYVGEQLNILCWKPIIQTTWPFGKYKGKNMTDIPNDYYIWALKNIPVLNEEAKEYDFDLAESVRNVLEQRLQSI